VLLFITFRCSCSRSLLFVYVRYVSVVVTLLEFLPFPTTFYRSTFLLPFTYVRFYLYVYVPPPRYHVYVAVITFTFTVVVVVDGVVYVCCCSVTLFVYHICLLLLLFV